MIAPAGSVSNPDSASSAPSQTLARFDDALGNTLACRDSLRRYSPCGLMPRKRAEANIQSLAKLTAVVEPVEGGGRPLGLCGQRLPELNLISIRVIDPGKATVGFIHSFGVNLYTLLF